MSSLPTFADLGIANEIVAVLARQGISVPFPIQVAAIPDAMDGRDVLGRAPTGSGKTLAFGIPMITRLPKAEPKRPTALILSPTRELAEQIRREVDPLAKVMDRRVLAVYGGVGIGKQIETLDRGVDVLVACPGRLLDLLEQQEVSLDAVRRVVVDEADRMADMGFLPDVRELLDQTSAREQTTFYSATLGPEVQVLTKRYQRDPVTHQVGETEPDLSLVTHRFIKTNRHSKVPVAAYLIHDAGPTIVFCRTRHGVDRVARQLKTAGVKASHIHGNRSQNQRDIALDMFTRGKVDALVATDVAARGIHVDGVACVIHLDPPEDETAYTHRSGRTARAGASGTVISFVNPDQMQDARRLQRMIGIDVLYEQAPDLTNQSAGTTPNVKGRLAEDSDGSPTRTKRPKASRKKAGPKKKHQKKVAASANKRRPSKQKQHAAKKSRSSASTHRGRG